MEANKKLKIYFDGLCPLCAKEIELYRKWDQNGRLQFIDIASSDFDATSEGLDPDRVHQFFHIKDTKGEVVEGVEAFARIWDHLEIFKPLSWAARNPIGRPVFQLGYRAFAKIRPYFRRKDCSTGTCELKNASPGS